MLGADGALTSEKEHEQSDRAGIAARRPRHALRFVRGGLGEARRRRAEVTTAAVTRIRKSHYGGYVVVSIPAKAVARAIRTAGGRVLVRGTHGYGEVYLDE